VARYQLNSNHKIGGPVVNITCQPSICALLVQHTPSPEEIKNLLAISDRDVSACQVKQLPADWRCTIAYNAALQAATAALAAAD
jgi:hypothetical protein